MHPVRRDSLSREVFIGRRLGGEEKIRDGIGQHPVDLFGHAPVEATESRFHVGEPDTELGRRDSPGQR